MCRVRLSQLTHLYPTCQLRHYNTRLAWVKVHSYSQIQDFFLREPKVRCASQCGSLESIVYTFVSLLHFWTSVYGSWMNLYTNSAQKRSVLFCALQEAHRTLVWIFSRATFWFHEAFSENSSMVGKRFQLRTSGSASHLSLNFFKGHILVPRSVFRKFVNYKTPYSTHLYPFTGVGWICIRIQHKRGLSCSARFRKRIAP
jgi:hypothetical protein